MSKTKKKVPMPSYYDDRAESKPEEDKFHRRNFAQRIADTIAAREDKNNIVIGIFGAWGTGKTTVLRFIQYQLKTEHKDKVICIEFNPWRFNDEDKLLINFFQEISEAIDVSLELWTEKVGGIAIKASNIIDKVGPEVFGKIVELIGITLSSKTLQEFKERVKKHLQEKKKHLVIFMDDIDRLDKSEIQAVFRLVKLTGDFPYTTYILAFDENKVAKALAEQYFSQDDDKDGRSFLEKIIQVPLHLPRVNSGDLDKYIEHKILDALHQVNIELPKEQLNLFFRLYRNSLRYESQTPRMAKLYANTLLFVLPILRDEVDTVDLMLLEGLRLFYPQIYNFVRSNQALFLGEDLSESIKAQLQGSQPQPLIDKIAQEIKSEKFRLTISEAQAITELLLFLFPHLEGQLYNFRKDKQLIEEKRVASRYHWNRYFSYGLTLNELSESQLIEFLQSLDTLSVTEIQTEIKRLIEYSNAREFVDKLEGKLEDLEENLVNKLALAIASEGGLFVESNDNLPSSFFSRAPSLIRSLLENISTRNVRYSIAEQVLETAQPIYFAYECFFEMRTDQRERQNELFDTDTETELGIVLVERIKKYVQSVPLIEDNNFQLLKLLSVWAGFQGQKETNQFLTDVINDNPLVALHIVKLALPYGVFSRADAPRLDKDSYSLVNSFVDTDIIYSGLQKLQIQGLDSPQYDLRDRPLEEVAAHQFAVIHKHS